MAGTEVLFTRNSLDYHEERFALLAVKELSSPGRSGIPEAQRKDTAEYGNKP
jgi:hypothetical protein